MPGEPAPGRVALAILLLRAVFCPESDEFPAPVAERAGCPGATMLAPRNAWKYSVAPSERLRVEAPRAMNLARAVVFGAVQRDQDIRPPRRWNGVSTFRCLDRLDEQPIEGRGRGAIQHLADVIVAGDGGNAEQGLAVGASLSLRQDALMRQERRAAH